MLNRTVTPMGDMTVGYDGQAGWMDVGGQARDMPASQNAELGASVLRQSIALLQNFEKPAYTVQALGPAEVEGKAAEMVEVSDPERALQVKIYVDPATNLIVMKRYTTGLMGPPSETDELYSDYRDVKGVKVPFRRVIKQGGKKGADITVTDLQVNPGIPESWYKKPQAK
jgi:hypothetical protein